MSELTCSICGKACLENAIISAIEVEGPGTNPAYYVMCPRCYSLCGSCVMCVSARSCPFETDPSPLPKQVQKTIRQGNMVMQGIVPNPDRIRETCQKSCKCWSDDFGCLKQNGTCANYKEVIPNVEV